MVISEVRELGEVSLDDVKTERWEFTGSKGDVYVVEKIDNMLKCSCPGYTFRGTCKHVKEVKPRLFNSLCSCEDIGMSSGIKSLLDF
mgnify:CR=1 FL=1